MHILIVFGTRPEAIKMAPVVKEFSKNSDIETKVCVTGQHRSMLDQVLTLFDIQPDYDLNIMKAGQSLYDVTADVLRGMEKVLSDFEPDWVLVHGDTTSAMAAAMAAFYKQIPVAHVEAGLRTGDLYRPWPEEMNRKVIDSLSELMFAPTELSRQALLNEGLSDDKIMITGNTVIDALKDVVERFKTDHDLAKSLSDQFPFLDEHKRLILVTGHRRESFGPGLENICQGLLGLASRDDVQIVYPVHLNENVRKVVEPMLGQNDNIHLIEPLSYLPFVYLMNRSHIVITDSGGIQEEAPALGKPVLVTRDVTERPEAVDAGTAVLVGTDKIKLIETTSLLLDDESAYQRMSHAHNPYGDGLASQRIFSRICQ